MGINTSNVGSLVQTDFVCADEGGAGLGMDVHYRVVKAFWEGTLLCESWRQPHQYATWEVRRDLAAGVL